MRRILLTILVLALTASGLRAQLARWVIAPTCQSVEKPAGVDLIVAQRADTTLVYTLDGQLLGATTDQLQDFQDGCAVTLRPGTQTVTGFFVEGQGYVSLAPCSVTHGYPYFSDGYLLVRTSDGYHFVDRQGRQVFDTYAQAYPFQQGYAYCRQYRNARKQQDLTSFYIDTEGRHHSSAPQGGQNEPQTLVIETSTLMVPVADASGRLGLHFNGRYLLQPQFDEMESLGLCVAKVRQGSGWGVIAVDSTAHVLPVLGGGRPVEFHHQTTTTTLTLPLPHGFDSRAVTVATKAASPLSIMPQTRRSTTTGGWPAVAYDCRLTLPSTMLVDTTTIDYELTVSNDGLLHQPATFTAQLRYLQLLALRDIEPGTLNGTTYTFDLHVDDRRDAADRDVPYTLEVSTNRNLVALNRLTADHYQCRISGLDKEDNNVYIWIQEEGCPKVVVTYEIVYQPPTPQTGGRAKAMVRRKQAPVNTPPTRRQQGGGQQGGGTVILPL